MLKSRKRKNCPPGCVKKPTRKTSRKRGSVKRKASRKMSRKKRKSAKRKRGTRKSSYKFKMTVGELQEKVQHGVEEIRSELSRVEEINRSQLAVNTRKSQHLFRDFLRQVNELEIPDDQKRIIKAKIKMEFSDKVKPELQRLHNSIKEKEQKAQKAQKKSKSKRSKESRNKSRGYRETVGTPGGFMGGGDFERITNDAEKLQARKERENMIKRYDQRYGYKGTGGK